MTEHDDVRIQTKPERGKDARFDGYVWRIVDGDDHVVAESILPSSTRQEAVEDARWTYRREQHFGQGWRDENAGSEGSQH